MAKEELRTNYLVRRSFRYILRYRWLIAVDIVFALIIAGLGIAIPYITKVILDDHLRNEVNTFAENLASIRVLMFIYIALLVATILIRYVFNYLQNLIGMSIERDIRHEAIRKIDHLPVDYFSLEPDGKIVAKVINDSNGVRQFYNVMFNLFNSAINIVIAYVSLVILQWEMALFILLVAPIIIVWITLYRKNIHGFATRIRELSSRITGKLNELISGALIIQAFNQEKLMLGEYHDLVDDYSYNERKLNKISSFFGFELIVFIKRVVEAGIITFFGIIILVNNTSIVVTTGLVYLFISLVDKMIHPINMIFENLNELEDTLVAANRVFMFIEEENDTQTLEGSLLEGPINGEISFRDLSFNYVPEQRVLADFSLDVVAGATIGIVGHTGSGKSTLMNLLLRYNDYDTGNIFLDGNDIRKYNKQSYRKHVGIILQTPALFAGTLRSNITLDREYSDEDVIKSLTAVGADYLLQKTDYGLNMNVSFKGDNLSLGEKQLICFARIMLRNPKILVLDEATANIDSETELKIKAALKVLTQNRTTFIIAHRLSTVKDTDLIIVMNNGKLLAKGKHDDLYDTCTVYKDMYDSQFQ